MDGHPPERSGDRTPPTGRLTALAAQIGGDVRVYVGKDPASGNPRQLDRTVRGSRRDAMKALAALVQEINAGHHRGPNATFAVLLDEWSVTLENTRSPNTADTYRSHIRKRIRPALGDIKLRAMTAHDLDSFYTLLLEEGLATGTVQVVHAIISAALSQGVKWGWIRESPARFATPPRMTAVERPTLATRDVRRLIDLAVSKDKDLGVLVFLAALTGCRRGELVGFRWPDVDWTTQTIRLTRSLVPAPGGGHREGPPKGKKARTAALGDVGVAMLARYREHLTERIGHEPTEWLLTYDGVAPLRAKMVSDYVTALGKRAGVALHLHELRHWSGSDLVAQGVDTKTVQSRLDHASLEETSGSVHGATSFDHEAAAILGRVLSTPAALSTED